MNYLSKHSIQKNDHAKTRLPVRKVYSLERGAKNND